MMWTFAITGSRGNELHEAIAANDLDAAERAIARGVSVDERESGSGQTPLMSAVLRGSISFVKLFLENNADVSIGEKDGYTPMHGAGFQGRAEIARMLVKHGLDPSDRHSDGNTPLHRACWGRQKRHSNTVLALLEAGVSVNEADSRGKTCMQITRNKQTRAVLEEWNTKKAGAHTSSKRGESEL